MRDLFLTVLVAALLCAHPAVAEPPSTSGAADLRYGLDFRLTLDPAADAARASVTLKQDRHLLREASFRLAGKRWTDFSGDGSIERRGDRLVWQPPASGGTLRWEVALDHERGDAYDALLRPHWALFRGEDAFPTAATRTLEDAYSESTLTVRAPSGWSVITRYAEVENPEVENRFPVVNPDRRFDRPTGWIVAGDLGVRRDVIAGVHTVVAGPVDQGVRRLDMLALLAWTLPEFVRLIPDFPDRLTIVSAADPMWRGALSGPDSLYVHAGRPLVSENGTSTILHELMHVGLGRDATPGEDWILEGLAEYYSVEMLRRTGTVTAARNRDTLAGLDEWGDEATQLRRRHSTGPTTARAVGVFRDLDEEIADRTEGEKNLDDVLRRLAAADGDIDLEELIDATTKIIGEEPRTLTSGAFRRLLGEYGS